MRNNAKILIVEDEALTADAIKSQIAKMGYHSVDIATTYSEALSCIENQALDLILLDIDLKSEFTGIDIAKERSVLNKIAVIYLTAYRDSATRRELIATNPKGYLTKPLRYEEMEVAIALALSHKNGIIDIGQHFSYDLKNENLCHHNKLIKLSQNERLLLEKLIEGRGEPIPLNLLEFAVWGNEVVSPSSLRTLVGKLRKKLNSDMIVTVSFFGYKLLVAED
jgi:DNA-binding response OmpR family regulator